MKRCFACHKQATVVRTVLSNDPFNQCSCDEHKNHKTFDSELWLSTEWKSISLTEDVHNHINRG
jgi:hypothetical protein